MPRARSSYTSDWQTAASTQGSGCLSGFFIPPLAVLLVGLLLAFFVKGLNTPVQAESLPRRLLSPDNARLSNSNAYGRRYENPSDLRGKRGSP